MADPSRPPHSRDRLPGRCLPGAQASLEPFRLPLTIFKVGASNDSIGARYEEVEMVGFAIAPNSGDRLPRRRFPSFRM